MWWRRSRALEKKRGAGSTHGAAGGTGRRRRCLTEGVDRVHARSRRGGCWPAVVVGVLSGCMIGPDYQRPALPAPAVFRGTADPAAPPDPTSLGDLRWFEVFAGCAACKALLRTALVANYDLRDAVARVDEARAQSRHHTV